MRKKIVLFLLSISVISHNISPVLGATVIEQYETVEFVVANSRLRASSIVLNTGWSFSKDHCTFSINFLNNSTGSGTVTLQKKVNSTWADHRSLNIEYKNVYSLSNSITVNNLSSGDYRLKFYLTANGTTETIYTSTKTL